MTRATTIVAVRRDGKTVVAGDGQVSIDDTIVKATAQKVRDIRGGDVVAGYAGAAADALALFERLEEKLDEYNEPPRAALELAKQWRTDACASSSAAAGGRRGPHPLISGNGDQSCRMMT